MTLTKYQRDAKKANRRRAHRAERLVREWVLTHQGTNIDLSYDAQMDALTDMLTDQQHFARVAELDWGLALERAVGHFRAEVEEEGGPSDDAR